MSFKRIGDYIQLVDKKNTDNAVSNLLGINITKNFMPSVANVSGTDLSKYKVINKGQFAYSAMQVGRDETIRLALYSEDNPAIISPAYLVIESKDENKLIKGSEDAKKNIEDRLVVAYERLRGNAKNGLAVPQAPHNTRP